MLSCLYKLIIFFCLTSLILRRKDQVLCFFLCFVEKEIIDLTSRRQGDETKGEAEGEGDYKKAEFIFSNPTVLWIGLSMSSSSSMIVTPIYILPENKEVGY